MSIPKEFYKEFDRVNKYLLLQEIFQRGRQIRENYIVYGENKTGGLGYIGLCKNNRDNKFYVLKTYKYDDNKNINLFKKEIEFALKLEKYPHIVYSQTAFKEDDRIYLVMELVGEQPKNENEDWKAATLTQELQKGISIVDSYNWAIQFCRGMQYLNSIGMKSHQDIKPDNILLTGKKYIKISDFGFITLKEEYEKAKGYSEYYYSPEHFIEDKEIDIRSDIYSFGIILYELFNVGINIQSRTQTRKLKRKNRFIEVNTIKSKHCNEIIKKCLQSKQENRYQTFKELEEALLKEAKKEIGETFEVEELPIENMKAKDFYYKGNGYEIIKKYKNAIEAYDKAIELEPKYTIAYQNRGFVKIILKQYEEAINDFDKVIELIPKDVNYKIYCANTYYQIGIAKYHLKQYENALKYFNKAIDFNPKDANSTIYSYLGMVKMNLKQYEEAMKDINKAIELNPKDNIAVLWKHFISLAKNVDKYYIFKIKEANEIIKLNPKSAIAYSNRGDIEYEWHEFKKAVKDYNRALNLNLKDVSLYIKIGNIKFHLKEYQKAIENYDKAIELNPKEYKIYYKRGIAKYHLKQYEEAIDNFNKTIELAPKYFMAYYYIGIIKDNLALKEEAQKNFKKYYELMIEKINKEIECDPKNYVAHYNLGHVKLYLKQYEDAIKCFNKTIELRPNSIKGYKNLIAIYNKLQKYKEAKEVEYKMNKIIEDNN